MAQKTLIGGTGYSITSGKTLIGGTGYSITGGKTLIGGTGYDIPFDNEALVYDGGDDVLMGEFSTGVSSSTSAGSEAFAGIADGLMYASGWHYSAVVPGTGNTVSAHRRQYCVIGPIDITDYNTLHVIGYREVSTVLAFVNCSETVSNNLYGSLYLAGTEEAEATLDISELSGEHYLTFVASNNGTTMKYAYISKIWFD